MTLAGDDLILQFPAHGRKVGIVAGNSDQKVTIVLGVFLGVAQDFRIEDVE